MEFYSLLRVTHEGADTYDVVSVLQESSETRASASWEGPGRDVGVDPVILWVLLTPRKPLHRAAWQQGLGH